VILTSHLNIAYRLTTMELYFYYTPPIFSITLDNRKYTVPYFDLTAVANSDILTRRQHNNIHLLCIRCSGFVLLASQLSQSTPSTIKACWPKIAAEWQTIFNKRTSMMIVRDFSSCPAAHCDTADGMPHYFLSKSPYKLLMIHEPHRCTVHFVKSLQLLTNKCTYITST